MNPELTLLAGFLMGLVGSVHCAGMCGGISGALAMGLGQPIRKRTTALAGYLFLFNAGRIASYALAGALAGVAGHALLDLLPAGRSHAAGQIVAGVFLIALGLYIGGWWRGLARLEKFGLHLWRRLQPLIGILVPVTSPSRALAVGLLWGWLPCGLVYAALAWSMAAGDAARGALLMAAFGAGTLAAVAGIGFMAGRMEIRAVPAWLQRLSGVVLIGAGIVMGTGLLPHGTRHQPDTAHVHVGTE